MGHLRVIGMTDSRTVLFDALSEMASRGRSGSLAKRSIPGTMPEVETVIREAGKPNFVHQQAHRVHERVVVQEGLAHAHEHEVDAVTAKLDLMPAGGQPQPARRSRLR